MDKVLHRIEHGEGRMHDIDLLVDVAKKIEGNTICPLGDAAAWPVASADAVLCINMIHISPVAATVGLVTGAARLLAPGSPLVVYGPFFEEGVETAPSNLAFDASLQARDPEWGLRSVEWLDRVASEQGFRRSRRVAMPANNVTLVYRRG